MKHSNQKKLIIFANNNIGVGQSGGDTIFLNFIKYWSNHLNIIIFASQESITLLNQHRLHPQIICSDTLNNSPSLLSIKNLVYHSLRRSTKSLTSLFKNFSLLHHTNYVYSISDFYPDLLPALICKLLNPRTTWLAGFYLFAPNPFSSSSPYTGLQRLKGLLYYLTQRPAYWLVNALADFVLITSQPDIKHFLTPHRSFPNIIVVRGGVSPPPLHLGKLTPKYDACFMGRLHPQKGIMLIPQIWQIVVRSRPNAKLAIIGDGQLRPQLIEKIKELKLASNIDVLGYQSGTAKEKIFRQSRIVVHPATYDSGGMSTAEAMVFGLPGVSFDLESLRTYYPQGVIKTPCFDINQFASNIIQLLNQPKLYNQTSLQAIQLINTRWIWAAQAKSAYQQIFEKQT